MLKFLGIGAQKAGTSWLHAQLARHPEIGFPLGKEAHFWNGDRNAGEVARYLKAFHDPGRCEGEITPAYALLPEARIREIHRAAPQLRLLFIVRNPIERAWSSALMALQRAELSMEDVGHGWFLNHFRSAGSLARGDYLTTLQRWRRVFGNEALLLLRYEDIPQRPQEVVQRCCAHLGVSPPDERVLEACDRAVFPGPGHPLPDALRGPLEALYRSRIGELERSLGWDLRTWVTPEVAAPRPTMTARLRRLREERGALRCIRESGLFDRDYYLDRYPDVRQSGVDPVRHYLRHGAGEGRNPSARFDSAAYLAAYPDVAAAGANPLVHYICFGAAEGRRPQPGAAAPGRAASSSRPAAGPRARPPFRDFAGFLRHAVFAPTLTAPFSEEERCVIEHMRARQAFLRSRHAALAADACASVILTCTRRGPGFERAVGSVLAQTWTNLELLIVDHGAEAPSAELPADPRIRVLGWTGGGPLGAALHRGVQAARGAYVAYLDADAQFAPDFLRLMVGELHAHPGNALAYCGLGELDAQEALSVVRYPAHPLALLDNQPCVDLRCVVHARALLDACGGFDEQMDRHAGWAFLRVAGRHTVPLGVPCLLCHSGDGAQDAADAAAADMRRLDAVLGEHAVAPRLAHCAVPGLERLYASPRVTAGGPPAARKVSIVIPSFECPDYLRLCIESVRAFTEGPWELIVVDNASSAPVRAYLANEPGITLIQNDHNYGFSYAVNQGIAAADPAADIILLNNDALVTAGWVQAMQQVLHDWPQTGLVVPRQVLPAGTQTIRTHNPAMDPRREADVNLSLHHDNVVDPLFDPVNGYVALTFAAFFCVYIPRRTLDEVGVLDHENAPHYRSDRLYCDAVRHLAGRPIVYTPHAKLYHFLQRATAQLRVADPQMFQGMFVKNEWAEVTRGAPPARSGG
ncbi:MAG: glycosyltransferase [Sinimarinibacterium flocculans]|uniref:glycosyltransferase n=1 Tax=Sinimarinibacterium flocculans TaxID=985250 RepID=UPI003C64D209